MKVIIAGSRTIKDPKILQEVINYFIEQYGKITKVVCGCAEGVDKLGLEWAQQNNVSIVKFPADWKSIGRKDAIIKTNKYGKYNARAGLDRNIQMADYADALIAIWDGKSTGTQHMIQTAKEKGLICLIIEI